MKNLLSYTLFSLIFTSLIVSDNTQAKASPLESRSPYLYTVIETDLRTALLNFGANLQIPINISPEVEGRISGRLPSQPPREFLTHLSLLYNFSYYYDGQMLHITPAEENQTRLISLDTVPFLQLKDTLGALSLLDERYMLRRSNEDRVVLVSGPPRYVELVVGTVSALANNTPLFPLKKVEEAPDIKPVSTQSQAPTAKTKDKSKALIIFRGPDTKVYPNGRPG